MDKKSRLPSKLMRTFLVQNFFYSKKIKIYSSDLKMFANSRPSDSNFRSFSRSLEQFFLTVGRNNFGNKIPLLPTLVCLPRLNANRTPLPHTYKNISHFHSRIHRKWYLKYSNICCSLHQSLFAKLVVLKQIRTYQIKTYGCQCLEDCQLEGMEKLWQNLR